MGKYVDLNHVLQDGMTVYPGLPAPKIGAFLDHEASRAHYADQAEFYLGRVDMVCNLGTYLDSPYHRHRDQADLSQIPLERVAGVPGVVLDAAASPDHSIAHECSAPELRGGPSLSGPGGTGDGGWMPIGSRDHSLPCRSSIS